VPVEPAEPIQGDGAGGGIGERLPFGRSALGQQRALLSFYVKHAFAVRRSGREPATIRAAHRARRSIPPRSAFAGFRFLSDVIVLAARWYRASACPLVTSRSSSPKGVSRWTTQTVYRWVLRFTPLLAEAARPCRHAVGDRWFVDETYVKVAGRWRYVYRAIDQIGQVIDVFVSVRGDTMAAHRFLERAIGTTKVVPVEVVTDQAATYRMVLEELLPAPWYRTEQYANNPIEADHGRLKARLGPMRGLNQERRARVGIAGHGFVQKLRPGQDELAVAEPLNRRVAVAFDELAVGIRSEVPGFSAPQVGTTQQTPWSPGPASPSRTVARAGSRASRSAGSCTRSRPTSASLWTSLKLSNTCGSHRRPVSEGEANSATAAPSRGPLADDRPGSSGGVMSSA
jgi:transposase-like protein